MVMANTRAIIVHEGNARAIIVHDASHKPSIAMRAHQVIIFRIGRVEKLEHSCDKVWDDVQCVAE